MASTLEKPLINIYVTNRCLLDCVYCGRSNVDRAELDAEASTSTLLNVIKAARADGYPRIKFSSRYGDPLMRDDLEELIAASVEARYEDISLSTNGLLLKKRVKGLRQAGLHRMCVSLDTLSRDKFRQMTGKDAFAQVVEGIELATKEFPRNVKINVVVAAGLNEGEIDDIIAWAFQRGIVPQFIEVVGAPVQSIYDKYHFPLDGVVARLSENALLVSDDRLDKRTTIILPDGTIEFRRSKACSRQYYTWERAVVHPDGQLGLYYNERPGVTLAKGLMRDAKAGIQSLKGIKISTEQLNRSCSVGNRSCVS